MSWVAGGIARDPFQQAMLGLWPASSMARFSSFLLFRRVRENSKLQSGMLGGARLNSPRNRGKVVSWEMQSFAGKGITQNQRVGTFPNRIRAKPRRWLRFFATFPCNLIVLSQDKWSLNMFVHRYG
jgi:hypothetical protein